MEKLQPRKYEKLCRDRVARVSGTWCGRERPGGFGKGHSRPLLLLETAFAKAGA